jgi:hypothetical protein
MVTVAVSNHCHPIAVESLQMALVTATSVVGENSQQLELQLTVHKASVGTVTS